MGRKPNILLITSDQQHWNTIGAFNDEIKTPNLDRLVNEGTTFSRCYCTNPTCTPSRASIITGKYPSQHGAYALGTKLPEWEHTVGEEFQRAGYKTALIGKAHFQPIYSSQKYPSLESYDKFLDLEYWKNFNGPFYGFEHVELARNHTNENSIGQHYLLWLKENGCKNWKDFFLPPVGQMDGSINHKWPIPEEFHYDSWIADRTTSMLENYKKNNENFFLWASFFDPHPQYLVPQPWDTMYRPEEITIPQITPGEHDKNPPHYQLTQQERPDFSAYQESIFPIDGNDLWGKNNNGIQGFGSHLHEQNDLKKDIAVYYGMVSLMDKYIGVILDKLDDLRLVEDTIVIFTSDHGHFYGHHGLIAKGPFHYEDMIRVPFIVRYPGNVPNARVNHSMQSLVDLAPTLLSFSGIPIPKEMSGIDQRMVWSGCIEKKRKHVICENHHEPTTVHLKTYVDERYKITIYYNKEYGELYDLLNDPEEINNLWNDPKYADLKADLLMKYIWAEMEKEPLWMPRIAPW
ncbi:MAG: sulfatase [Clostridia bacterium]